MCLFCGCSVILNRNPENEERYVNYLIKEIDLVRHYLQQNHSVKQLHFGGGTPTKLSEELLMRLFGKIREAFSIDFNGEIAIEIDPRTVVEDRGSKLKLLRQLGFNRVSFGVQDTDPQVQQAIRRRQSYEMTLQTYTLARQLGFSAINIDLIYGLPEQTPETFADTVDKILAMRPDRIALFSYAKVPWLKPHQKAIPEASLPSTLDKLTIYAQTRKRLMEGSYVAIGMDHFALRDNELARALHSRSLQRNFQGYSLRLAEDIIPFGVTAIGHVRDGYFQNHKELSDYYRSLDSGLLPIHRGKILSQGDLLRRWVIHSLMCDFELDKRAFAEKFQVDFDVYFAEDLPALKTLVDDGLLIDASEKLTPTGYGQLFIRNIAMTFDWYLKQKEGHRQFSKAV